MEPWRFLGYLADNISQGKRVSAFGVLTGVMSAAFVGGTLTARLLSTSRIFQVPYASAIFGGLLFFALPALRSIVSKQVGPHEQVDEVRGDDVVCVSKNSATLVGSLFTLHASQIRIELPTLSDADKQETVVADTKMQSPFLARHCTDLQYEEPEMEIEMQDNINIKEGYVYEVDHSQLLPRNPVLLRLIRVVMVTEKTEVNVVVMYPNMESLRAFFDYSEEKHSLF